MRSLLVYVLICCITLTGECLFAQSRVTDSLEHRLKNIQGKDRVNVLNQLTYEYITQDNAKVLSYNAQALALSKNINDLGGEAKAYTYLGVHQYLSGQLSEGHRNLNIGLRLATKAGTMPFAVTRCYNSVCAVSKKLKWIRHWSSSSEVAKC